MRAMLSVLDENAESKSCRQPALQVVGDGQHEPVPVPSFRGRAALVTLGCAKNQVDSEVMGGVLKAQGFELVAQVEDADVAVVNTCGFLQSAVKESIDCILEVSDFKRKGRLRTLIVAGCAVERYREELRKSLPEVDIFLTLDDLLKVGSAAEDSAQSEEFKALLNRAERPYFLYDEKMPRVLSSAKHNAYVKIAEGCNRPCTFCIIPAIRGAMRSRSIASVLAEAQQLRAGGVKEINLIAQDLTSFGSDRGSASLAELLRLLNAESGVDWIRLLYAYPIGVNEELLSAIRDLPRVVEYLDLPLQHVSEPVLKAMKRPLGNYAPRKIAEMMKEKYPEIALRTTFIVGFPGETDEDVAALEDFVREGFFASVGVFSYSPEEGTPAFEMAGHVTEREKKSRRARIMRAQQRALQRRMESFIGSSLQVLIDGVHEESELLLKARARFQAPEVDGCVIINDIMPVLSPEERLNLKGRLGKVRISEVSGYDLVGVLQEVEGEL